MINFMLFKHGLNMLCPVCGTFYIHNFLCFQQWATLRIETGVAKQSALKNSASVGKSPFSL